jgi:ferredoxin
MQADTQAQVAFFLTGWRAARLLDPVDDLELRPALLAGYRDLSALRHDYPVVLAAKHGGATPVMPLSALMDEALAKAAIGDDAPRVRQHGLRLEQEIRALLAGGSTAGLLSVVWDLAVSRLVPKMDPAFADSCKRLRAAIKADGELAGCDAALPTRMVRHLWHAAQAEKAARFRARLERLVVKLSDILRADFERSREGLSAARLQASVGPAQAAMIDFDALSKLLVKVQTKQGMPESRRARINSLLDVFKKQRFFGKLAGSTAKQYDFAFDSCADALKAYAEREPKLVELARAVVIAELEIEGEYSPERHDAMFEGYGATGLAPKELAAYPDYLVCINGGALSAQEHGRLMDALGSGWPIKVLLQIDDLHDGAAAGDGGFAAGLRSSRIASQAMALNDVFVLQSSSSNLIRFAARAQRGLSYSGPALFSVFSGASACGSGLPPYLMAAAAMESRAFPAFSYDPSAGPDWADRFCLAANTQVERDWPVQAFGYEDEQHQRVAETLPFTLVDFLASDRRYAGHLARVPREKWNGSMIRIDEALARPDRGLPDHVPSLLMVDGQDRLQKVVVDQSLVRQADRCRQMWHSLQELAGVHNSHARKLLAREHAAWDQRLREQAPVQTVAAPAAAAGAAPVLAAALTPAEVATAVEEPARAGGEAYIETERCSSCNECTQLNPKLFAYNENQQAYIADINGGTYAELVQAAENCQVAVIHPGQPRNANEPGLAELLERAKPFQ